MPGIEALAPGAGLVAFATGWNLGCVRGRGRTAWPAVVAALALPFAIPTDWVVVRLVSTVLAVVLAFKTWELARGRISCPAMLATPGRAAFWLFIPPDSRVPRNADDARQTRANGTRRLLRGLAKVPLALALWGLEIQWPAVHANAWVEATWALWLTWAASTAITDAGSGLAMWTGFDVIDPFDAPFLARSPRDFWGARWNLFVHRWARRNIFVPSGGRRHPVRGVIVVFVFSGLLHEYLVLAAMGRPPDRVGWMTAFFALHGIAVLAEIAVRRRRWRSANVPRPVAVFAHAAWLTATAPLFFGPIGEVLAPLASVR